MNDMIFPTIVLGVLLLLSIVGTVLSVKKMKSKPIYAVLLAISAAIIVVITVVFGLAVTVI